MRYLKMTATRKSCPDTPTFRRAVGVGLFAPVALLALGISAPAFGDEPAPAEEAVRRPPGFRVVYPKLPGFGSPESVDEDRAKARLEASPVPLKLKLAKELPLLGHRNWIVVADSAYPAQSRPGIETVYVGGDQARTVEAVLQAVDAAKHVRGVVYMDAELEHVAEADAPGIGAYRQRLSALLGKRPVKRMPHDEVIAELDEAAEMFRILILKTDMTMAYTTVFVQLECGYWDPGAEKRLRDAIDARAK